MPCANNSVNTSVATGDQEVQFSTNYQLTNYIGFFLREAVS